MKILSNNKDFWYLMMKCKYSICVILAQYFNWWNWEILVILPLFSHFCCFTFYLLLTHPIYSFDIWSSIFFKLIYFDNCLPINLNLWLINILYWRDVIFYVLKWWTINIVCLYTFGNEHFNIYYIFNANPFFIEHLTQQHNLHFLNAGIFVNSIPKI